MLTQIQDEVHRYAISFHRNLRSKNQLKSELDEIKGIGPKSKAALLEQLKSVKQIQAASKEQLIDILGEAKGTIVYTHFHP